MQERRPESAAITDLVPEDSEKFLHIYDHIYLSPFERDPRMNQSLPSSLGVYHPIASKYKLKLIHSENVL